MALKKIYLLGHNISITNNEKSFYHCHVITCCVILVATCVYVATKVRDTN